MEKKHELHLRDMTRGVFYGLQPIPKAGYHWEEKLWILDPPSHGSPKERDGPWLVEAHRGDSELWGTNERLFARSDAHRRFAGLRTPRDIVQFANKYGMLGKGWKYAPPLMDADGMFKGWGIEVHEAEHLATWDAEIAQMDILIRLWDLASQGRDDVLQHFITWEQSPRGVNIRFHYLFGRQRRLTSVYDTSLRTSNARVYPVNDIVVGERMPSGSDLLSRFSGDKVLDPVRWYVKKEVNKRLKGHVNPVLLLNRDALYFEPDSLLAALYSLFALELSGQDKPHILCAAPRCGKYVTGKRKGTQYCSDACRNRAYDHRKNGRIRGAPLEGQAAGTEE